MKKKALSSPVVAKLSKHSTLLTLFMAFFTKYTFLTKTNKK